MENFRSSLWAASHRTLRLHRTVDAERDTNSDGLRDSIAPGDSMDGPFVRATPARDPLIGRVLHDRYRVLKRIGKGGMGIVYLAEHVLLNRKVALKTLSDRAFATEELVARFQREAMAAAAVGNEHIVGVTDMGRLEDGSYFIVLEYLEGVELAWAASSDGPLELGRAIGIALQLCDALTAVHAAGIVHRDLKPENLFLVERDGQPDFVKVLDFGVCKAFEDRPSGHKPLTRTGVSLGTPEFMAPEQIDTSADADKRADLYAVGAILFFALTGEAPFHGSGLPMLLMRISSEPPPSLCALRPDLPPALDAVIQRALQKRPEDRFQDSAELRAALLPFARGAGDVGYADAGKGKGTGKGTGKSDTAAGIELALGRERRSWPVLHTRETRRLAVAVLAAVALFVVGAAAVSRIGVSPGAAVDGAVAPAPVARSSVAPSAAALNLELGEESRPTPPADLPSKPLGVQRSGGSRETAAARATRVRTPIGSPEPDAIAAPPPAMPVLQPAPAQEPEPEAAAPPATPAATPTDGAYRLSERGLKEVF